MTKRIHHILFPALVLLALALALVLSPRALAAEEGGAADDVLIAEDGTVTLRSDHAAAEGVSSVQLKLTAEAAEGESLGFSFSSALEGRLTKAAVKEDGLYLYIAGAQPLMSGETRQLVLGTVTGAQSGSVALEEGSLAYVYGRRTAVQTVLTKAETEPEPDPSDQPGDGGATETPTEPQTTDVPAAPQATTEPGTAQASREELQIQLDRVSAAYDLGAENKDNYTPESWDALMTAIDRAVSLLADDAASKEELDSAISQLQAAVDALVPAGRAELESTLEQARGYDGSGYTADSFAALQAAIAEAQKALDAAGSDGARWADAQSKLEKAIEGLIPQTEADSNGGVIQDGPDSGVGDGSGDSPASTAAPTAAPSGPRSPSTGDETVLAPWVLMMALSAALLAAMALRRKKCR